MAPVIRRALWLAVLLGLLFYLGLSLWLAFRGIFFPYQLDYGEGLLLWYTHELALGHSIYKGLEGLPYISSNYPPLAMALAAPFRAIFGDSYIMGRWLNFAAALLSSAFLARMVLEETRGVTRRARRFFALAAALLFLGSTFIYHWLPLFRVDLIGLAFSVAGVFFIWRWEHGDHGSKARLYLSLAAICFLAALYTKHSLLFAPAAAALAIWRLDRRMAVLWAAGLALAGGAIFFALNLVTGGGLFFGLFIANATQWLWSIFFPLTVSFVATYLVILALGIVGWIAAARARRIGVLEIYAAAALASTALAGRVGAWENYYFEAIFAACLMTGLGMARLVQVWPSSRWWLPFALMLQLFLFWNQHDPAIARQLMEITRSGNDAVRPFLQESTGPVISEDIGLLVTNDKPVIYHTFEYSSLARAGLWDQHWELPNLMAGRFSLVVLSQGTREDVDHFRNFTREFMSALDYGYAVALDDARYKVYRPAPLQNLQSASFAGRLELVGWSLVPGEKLAPGREVDVTVVWRAARKLETNYTAFVHLEDTSGRVIAQDDHAPRVGLQPWLQPYPTSAWGTGEMMREHYSLQLPRDIQPGRYFVRAGWYDSETQDRLPAGDGQDYIELTAVELAAP